MVSTVFYFRIVYFKVFIDNNIILCFSCKECYFDTGVIWDILFSYHSMDQHCICLPSNIWETKHFQDVLLCGHPKWNTLSDNSSEQWQFLCRQAWKTRKLESRNCEMLVHTNVFVDSKHWVIYSPNIVIHLSFDVHVVFH